MCTVRAVCQADQMQLYRESIHYCGLIWLLSKGSRILRGTVYFRMAVPELELSAVVPSVQELSLDHNLHNNLETWKKSSVQ